MIKALFFILTLTITGFYPQNLGSVEPPFISAYPHVIMVGPGCRYVLEEPGGRIVKEEFGKETDSDVIQNPI
jgi:hypothetical protein